MLTQPHQHNKPHVLMVTQCFPPELGGIQSLMAQLAQALAHHLPLTVITDHKAMLAPKPPWDQRQSYPIQRVRGPKAWRKHHKAKRLQRMVRNMKASVLITDTWKSAEYLLATSKNMQVPSIILAHGNDVLSRGCNKRATRIQQVLQQAQQVVAVSHDTAKRVRALGIKHCCVIHNGVQVMNISRQTPTHTGPRLLTIARLEPRKGHDQVIKALATLKERWPNIHYDIAGTGTDLARLKSLVEQHQLQQHVSFLGAIDDQRKTELLHQATIFVMPVRHDQSAHSIEGFGMALAEAQMAGCVVLTGQVGGVLDVVQDQVTGYCCDGDASDSVLAAIRHILQHPEHAQSCVQAAQAHANKHFSIAAMTEQYLTLINNIVQLKPHAETQRN